MRISHGVWGDRACTYVLHVGDGAPIGPPPHDQFLHLGHVLQEPCQVVVHLTWPPLGHSSGGPFIGGRQGGANESFEYEQDPDLSVAARA